MSLVVLCGTLMPSLKAREMLVREVIWGMTGGKAANWMQRKESPAVVVNACTHVWQGWGVFGGMAKVGG